MAFCLHRGVHPHSSDVQIVSKNALNIKDVYYVNYILSEIHRELQIIEQHRLLRMFNEKKTQVKQFVEQMLEIEVP